MSATKDVVIRFDVHVHPGSRTSVAGGIHDGALCVHVRARAIDGAATIEVLEVVANAFGVRSRAVTCVRGMKSHNKTIEIDGDEKLFSAQLEQLLANESRPVAGRSTFR
jgi:uncharacterized protein YggU (UPF0235/DUF167 family)